MIPNGGPDGSRSATARMSRFRVARLLPCSLPEEKRGWCQTASVQSRGFAARSASSQRPCGEVRVQPPTFLQFEFSTTMCQLPMS